MLKKLVKITSNNYLVTVSKDIELVFMSHHSQLSYNKKRIFYSGIFDLHKILQI